jgi:competence protein ComEC
VAGAVCIVAYVAFVGSQPSLVRSVLMYVFGAAAILAGRPRRGAALLGAAFLVQLGLDPASALSLSFVLSYLALAGILWVGAAADELQDGLVPAFVRTPLAASIGAFTLTAPVVVAFFGSLRPIGIPAALLLVPLASLFMVLALAYLVLAAAVPFAAHPLALVLSALYRVNNRIVRFAAEAPEWPLDNTVLALILSLAVSVLLLYLRQRINHTRMRLDPFD